MSYLQIAAMLACLILLIITFTNTLDFTLIPTIIKDLIELVVCLKLLHKTYTS